ncbi:hypothetical protein PSH58_22135 [Pseudomonas hefeiensis]|uniref:Uncharacterized protein n=1 Tax=Pseudomonas hefeiensis TaxID=2738125 RepID=A0ABY9G7M3_9PSED|nr:MULTISPECIES: hypothetical protein [unclassified Pseudomonas]WLH11522.1 hypothetical protein PSH57_22105 [Pseudomonas sp. FP205]WLH94593.1 hypothetical protein PSH58_22135 [Pseudomonas sp. FP53]WLI38876.1 hypothetical protein PSH74_22090 [Pseudomonas sp. FP821]
MNQYLYVQLVAIRFQALTGNVGVLTPNSAIRSILRVVPQLIYQARHALTSERMADGVALIAIIG